jgi:hypothetical protein
MAMPENRALGNGNLEDRAAVVVDPEDGGNARSQGRDVAAHNDSGGAMQKNVTARCGRTWPRHDPEVRSGGTIQAKMESGSRRSKKLWEEKPRTIHRHWSAKKKFVGREETLNFGFVYHVMNNIYIHLRVKGPNRSTQRRHNPAEDGEWQSTIEEALRGKAKNNPPALKCKEKICGKRGNTKFWLCIPCYE